MDSIKIAEISRPDSESLEKTAASITEVQHLASYSWIEAVDPTIAVPGIPPLWSPPETPTKVPKDSGLIYIAQNAARHPGSPLEPLFRALYITNPSFDIGSIDLVTDRNNIRKLLSFINPALSRDGLESFTINVETTKNTAIFCRAESETSRFIAPNEFRGFGHEFEKAYTTNQVADSTGHHRIISYKFGGLNLMVRYETDAYVETVLNEQHGGAGQGTDDLSSAMESLSLQQSQRRAYKASAGSKLMIREQGKAVPIESTLEMKTRVLHKPIELQESLSQLWASQTLNLVRAYHRNGLFRRPAVEDTTTEMKKWEEDHQEDLRGLAQVIKRIVNAVRESGGSAAVRYDDKNDRLGVYKTDDRMLPDDLYSKLDNKHGEEVAAIEDQIPAIESNTSKTTLHIGDIIYDVDLSKIPYLASFVRFQRAANPQTTGIVHGDIPLFDTALKGLELGYRHCFRSLPADIAQYHILCSTYDFLQVDVLEGQSISDISAHLRACKTDYELDYKRYRPIKGDKSAARDAAFRLVFLILKAEFKDETKDSNKVYNAVLFVISHPGTFKQRTRSMVRAAHEDRFEISPKQRHTLDRWASAGRASDDERTTEEEFSDFSFHSDYS